MIPHQWYAILPSTKVKKQHMIAIKRLNKELAVYRDSKGQLHILEDQCSHRGAALTKGKVLDNDCVQCPFHGLEFTGDGTCVKIPANGQKALVEPRFHIKAYAVREAHDIVYLWLGDRETADWEVRLPFFEPFIDETFVYSEVEDLWQIHYSRAIENQLDVVHLPFIHHNTIGRGRKTLVNGPQALFIENTLVTSADNAVDEGQVPRRREACEINPAMQLRFKYPNIWLNLISEKVKVMVYFAPVDETHTILYLRFYNRITGVKAIDHFIAFFGKFANIIIERQDKRVVQTQRPSASSFKMNEKLIPGDYPILLYRKIRQEKIDSVNMNDSDSTL